MDAKSAFDPALPPRWVVALNTPMPRASKAAANIVNPPGFTSSKGKSVRSSASDDVVIAGGRC